MDSCCLFSQHVLVLTLLIEGVQMWWLVPGLWVLGLTGSSSVPPGCEMGVELALATTPGVWVSGSCGLQPLLKSGREVAGAHNHSWSPGGSWQGPVTTSRVHAGELGAHDHFWGPGQSWPWPVITPGAHAGSVLPSVSMCTGKKSTIQVPPLPLCTPPQTMVAGL